MIAGRPPDALDGINILGKDAVVEQEVLEKGKGGEEKESYLTRSTSITEFFPRPLFGVSGIHFDGIQTISVVVLNAEESQ